MFNEEDNENTGRDLEKDIEQIYGMADEDTEEDDTCSGSDS
jgi:hypothetical protein